MNKINSIKVGNTSYQVEGSGGAVFDATFSVDIDNSSATLVEGDFASCLDTIQDNDFVSIGISASYNGANYMCYPSQITVGSSALVMSFIYGTNNQATLTWTSSSVSVSV